MSEQERKEHKAERYIRRCQRRRELMVERLLVVSAAVLILTLAGDLGTMLGKEGSRCSDGPKD